MSPELPPDDDGALQALWQAQPVAPQEIDMDALMTQASKFHRTIQFRNVREWLASAFVVVVFGQMGWAAPGEPLLQLGCALVIAGAAWISWTIARRGQTSPAAVDSTAVEHLRVHRQNLEQQVRMLRSVPRWYLAPLVPGMVLINVASYLTARHRHPVLSPQALGIFVAAVAFQVAVFALLAWLNRVAARKLQADVAALDAALAPPAP